MPIREFAGKQPTIANSAYVDTTALVIGDVIIGADSSVWPMSVVRGDINAICIGARCNLQDHCVVHVNHDSTYFPGGSRVTIGDDVTIGHRVTLHGCTIEDRCLIGMGSIVMDGAVIHPHVLLGAGSLVPSNKKLESGYLWLGNPVKKIRPLSAQEIELIAYSAAHYVEVKEQYCNT